MTKPSLADWKRLYELSEKFWDLNPWNDFGWKEIIGIEIPETKETVYCSIINENGNYHVLSVMTDNLKNFYQTLASTNENEGEEAFHHQKGIMVQYAFKDFIYREFNDPYGQFFLPDIEIMKKININPGYIYPFFRDYSPGCQPWYLTKEQVKVLITVFERLNEIVPEYEENKKKLFSKKKYEYPVQYFDTNTGKWKFKKVMVKPETEKEAEINRVLLQKVSKYSVDKNSTIAIGCDYSDFMSYKKGTPRPLFAITTLFVNKFCMLEESFTSETEGYPEVLLERFLKYCDGKEKTPGEILVHNQNLYNALKQIAEKLGINLVKVHDIPRLREAMGLYEHIGNMGRNL